MNIYRYISIITVTAVFAFTGASSVSAANIPVEITFEEITAASGGLFGSPELTVKTYYGSFLTDTVTTSGSFDGGDVVITYPSISPLCGSGGHRLLCRVEVSFTASSWSELTSLGFWWMYTGTLDINDTVHNVIATDTVQCELLSSPNRIECTK